MKICNISLMGVNEIVSQKSKLGSYRSRYDCTVNIMVITVIFKCFASSVRYCHYYAKVFYGKIVRGNNVGKLVVQ